MSCVHVSLCWLTGRETSGVCGARVALWGMGAWLLPIQHNKYQPTAAWGSCVDSVRNFYSKRMIRKNTKYNKNIISDGFFGQEKKTRKDEQIRQPSIWENTYLYLAIVSNSGTYCSSLLGEKHFPPLSIIQADWLMIYWILCIFFACGYTDVHCTVYSIAGTA